MAKFTNLLNSEKERDDVFSEFPEINKIGDLLKLMWEVISFTEHSNQHKDPYLTDHKRYENAIKAMFGSNYSKIRMPPDGYSYDDIREIILEKNRTGNLEGAIKNFLVPFFPIKDFKDVQQQLEYDAKRETELLKDFEAIKKHYYATRHLYEGPDFEAGKGFPWETP